MNILIVGAKRREIEWTGTCSTNETKLILQVQANSEKTEQKLPFEITGVLENGVLILYDELGDSEKMTKYRRL